MEPARLLQDLFDPEAHVRYKAFQGDVIKYFKELVNKLYVLQGQREAEAIPDMLVIIDFMEKLSEGKTLLEMFSALPDVINFLMDTFFPDLAGLIFRAAMFPNETVLNCTAKFLELYIVLSLRAFIGGFPYNMRAVESILNPEKTNYYTANNAKVNSLGSPFGEGMGEDENFDSFVSTLKEGDEVDAVKTSTTSDSKMIWSRGIVSDVKLHNVYVNFLHENQPILKDRMLKKAPFSINRPGTRALDFDWRQGLKKDDEVDLYIAKEGWFLYKVMDVIEQFDNKDSYRFIKCEQVKSSEESGNAHVCTINVHDAILRKPHSYSDQRFVSHMYANEEIYEYANENMVAVSRTHGDSTTIADSLYFINNKFFIRFINVIGLNGGFEHIRQVLDVKDNHCNPTLVGYFMSIIASCAPYLLRRKVMTVGKDFAELGMRYIFEASPESLKNMSKEVVESIYKAFEQLAKRIYSHKKAKELTENFYLKIGMIFVSTDNLERKLNGLMIISQIANKIRTGEFDRLTREELAEMLEKENILEQVIKGHTQLISKSIDLFKMMLEEGKVSEKILQMLWTTLRKADLDTRNALFSLLNETFSQASIHATFFVNRIAEVEPKQMSVDEIEFLTRLVNLLKLRSADSPESIQLSEKALRVLWKVCTDPDVSNPEVVEKAAVRMITLMKYGFKTNIDEQILSEAVENVRYGRAVLQSLKVMRKILVLREDIKEVIQFVLDKDILKYVFENLQQLKRNIKEKIEKAGVDLSTVTETTINQYLPNKSHTFEQNILKRLRFIDFVIYSCPQDKDRLVQVIAQIWDELVVNSLIDAEAGYFKKWFVKFSGKEAEHIVDKAVLYNFFFDKIKTLYSGNSAANRLELLKTFTEIFYRINMLGGLIVEHQVTYEDSNASYHTETTKGQIYQLQVSPEKLEGIDALWDLMEATEDESIANSLTEVLTKLYIRTDLDRNDEMFRDILKSFVQRCQKLFDQATVVENWEQTPKSTRTVQRVLHLLIEIVDLSESIFPVTSISLSSLYRGEKVALTIENSITVAYDSPKKLNLKVFGNTTILEVKKKIAQELTKITWKHVRLSRPNKTPELQDKHNSRTLRDMRVTLGEKMLSFSKPQLEKKTEPLTLKADELNPKAVEVFKEIFRRFAGENPVMGPLEVSRFASAVLEVKQISQDDSKVKDVIKQWDNDKDGALNEEEFLNFYKVSSIQKPQVVRSNLISLGYGTDLCLKNIEEIFSEEDLARYYLTKSEVFLTKLFDQLDKKDAIGKLGWELFSRLPPLPSVIKKILLFDGLDRETCSNWDCIIETSSVYKTLYCLYIIDYLIDDTSENAQAQEGKPQNETQQHSPLDNYIETDVNSFRREWRNQFIKLGGFVHLTKILNMYIHRGISSRLEMVLFSFIMKPVSNYILASVTLQHPEIYRNVSYISLGVTSLALLSKNTKQEKKKSIVEAFKEVLSKPVQSNKDSEVQPFIGPLPQNQAMAGPVNKSEATSDQTTIQSTHEAFQQSKMAESDDFIQFRESLKNINDDSLSRMNVIETLRFVVKLCEGLLNKVGNIEFEEINIVKLGLSIFFSLLLNDTNLLRQSVLTEDIKLLPENSSSKLEGYSDLVSFLLAGMLNRLHFVFSRYYVNAFFVCMRESKSADIQTILVKAIMSNIGRSDLPSNVLAKSIDVACSILDSVCADEKDKDNQILLTKSDINSIFNFEVLFFKLLDSMLDSNPQHEDHSEIVAGHFKLLQKILAVEPKLKLEVSKRSNQKYILRLFRDCLFNLSANQSEDDQGDSIKCKNTVTRQACYDFLVELCRGNIDNCSDLIDNGLHDLCQNLPTVNSWRYTPSKDKRSPQGFLGIYNLRNICYINSMLQQLYMTPPFRYGILLANDRQAALTGQDKEGREIDDNLLHQLQKMFAYLDRSERAQYNPYDFCFSFKDYTGNSVDVSIQQDTQEFFNIFFDKIESTLKNTPLKNLLKEVYGGTTIDLLGCTSCGHLRATEQIFYNLSLEVKNQKTIKDSLDKLTTEDVISDFKCEHCQQKCDVTKRPLIKDCPNVLIVYLSRIIFDLDVLMNVKINTRYEFQDNINLKPYTYDYYLQTTGAEGGAKPAEGATQPETSEGLKEMKEGGKETEEAVTKKPAEPKQLNDEDYEYKLAGILVHRGSAEAGHYFSYINVNRNDPRRPKK